MGGCLGVSTPKSNFENKEKTQAHDFEHKPTRFEIGQRVQCRDHGEEWMDATITCLDPIECKPDKWADRDFGAEWAQVREMPDGENAPPPVRDRTSTLDMPAPMESIKSKKSSLKVPFPKVAGMDDDILDDIDTPPVTKKQRFDEASPQFKKGIRMSWKHMNTVDPDIALVNSEFDLGDLRISIHQESESGPEEWNLYGKAWKNSVLDGMHNFIDPDLELDLSGIVGIIDSFVWLVYDLNHKKNSKEVFATIPEHTTDIVNATMSLIEYFFNQIGDDGRIYHLSASDHKKIEGYPFSWQLNDWHDTIRWPHNIRRLDLSRSNFCGDLSGFTELEELSMKLMYLKNWDDLVFPPNLKKLNLMESNFEGDLSHLTSLKEINMMKVKKKDWSKVIFPISLQKLYLQTTNYDQDLSNLTNLKHLNLSWVRNKSWEKVRFPTELRQLTLMQSNFPHEIDLSYMTACRINR